MSVPRLSLGRLGAALATDARSVAPYLLSVLRPGPAGAVDPMAPGPRPRVQHAAALQAVRISDRRSVQLGIMSGRVGGAGPVPYTVRDARNAGRTRAAVAGQGSIPLSYTYSDTARFLPPGASADVSSAGAAPGSSGSALPCVDCG